MSYNGAEDDDSPVHGSAISFDVREFLHIKVRITNYNLCLPCIYMIQNLELRVEVSAIFRILYFGKRGEETTALVFDFS